MLSEPLPSRISGWFLRRFWGVIFKRKTSCLQHSLVFFATFSLLSKFFLCSLLGRRLQREKSFGNKEQVVKNTRPCKYAYFYLKNSLKNQLEIGVTTSEVLLGSDSKRHNKNHFRKLKIHETNLNTHPCQPVIASSKWLTA